MVIKHVGIFHDTIQKFGYRLKIAQNRTKVWDISVKNPKLNKTYTMKKLYSLIALSFAFALSSSAQVVVYDIVPADFIALNLTSGDICSPPWTGPEEAKQMAINNTWGFTWTSTGSGTPSSVDIEFYNTITGGNSNLPTTLNGTASGNVNNGTYISCTGGSLNNTWSISPASYVPSGTNTFMVDFANDTIVNQFDHFPTTTNVYFRVTVDYTPCTPPIVQEALTNVVCFGGSTGEIDLTVTGTGPFTYDWDIDGTGDFDDSEDITGLPAGSYAVAVMGAGGCVTNASYTITEGSPLDVTTSVSNGTFMATASGMTYQWVECPTYTVIAGATSQSYTPEINGDYAVIISDGTCSDTSACTTINNIGVTEFDLGSIAVYPNPTLDIIKITMDGSSEPININVYDVNGKLIYSELNIAPNTQLVEVDLSNHESGNYMVRINAGSEEISIPVVKK